MDRIEWELPHLLKDPLPVGLGRLAPGRDVIMSLYWAPPRQVAMTEQQVWHEQFISQLTGSRTWTLCPGVTSSPPTDRSFCHDVKLRRGDMLYIPPLTWHWTREGPSESAHLMLGVLPLVMADFVSAGLGDNRAKEAMNVQPIMGSPLPLWAHNNTEDAAPAIAEVCQKLPFQNATNDMATLCALPMIKMAMRRLIAGPSPPQSNDGKSKQDNSARGRRRRRGNQNRIDLMTLFGYVLLGIIVFLLGVWCICGLEFEKQEQNPSQQQYQVPRRRPARRAHSTKAAWRVWAPKSSHTGKFE